jgi:hypothetical protein
MSEFPPNLDYGVAPDDFDPDKATSLYVEYPEGSLGYELERIREEIQELWFPLRWWLTRKLDKCEGLITESRNQALRRYLDS